MELHYVLKLVNFDYAFNTIINPQDQVNPPLQGQIRDFGRLIILYKLL